MRSVAELVGKEEGVEGGRLVFLFFDTQTMVAPLLRQVIFILSDRNGFAAEIALGWVFSEQGAGPPL